MRYIEIEVPSLKEENKKKKRKRLALVALTLIFATIVGFTGYIFYWPISAIVGQILKNPQIAFSFFRQPAGELKSTDGKTNFLILGIDKRVNVPYTFFVSGGSQKRNGFLSDTIIVASVDQNTKQVSLISIPRDTWVAIPEWSGLSASSGKINSAYSLGDVYGYPGGGLKLSERVVSENLGVPIHYGMRIDFEGFKKAIDTLGGIDIVIEKSFDDYQYPAEGKEKANCADGSYSCRSEHIHFDAGPAHMDGTTALKFARSRTGTNGEGSDFARARRQQKIIQAFFKKSISVGNLLDPVKLSKLSRDFGQAVETDFDLTAIPQTIKLSKEVNFDNVRTLVLDPSSGVMYHPDDNLYGGAYVLIPKRNWNEVQTKIKEFISNVAGASK